MRNRGKHPVFVFIDFLEVVGALGIGLIVEGEDPRRLVEEKRLAYH